MHDAGLYLIAAGRLYLTCKCTALMQMLQGFTSPSSVWSKAKCAHCHRRVHDTG